MSVLKSTRSWITTTVLGFVAEQPDGARTDQFLNRLTKLETESVTSNNVEGEQEQMHVLSPDSANYWIEVVRKATEDQRKDQDSFNIVVSVVIGVPLSLCFHYRLPVFERP